MSEQLPADIAEAIASFGIASHALGQDHAYVVDRVEAEDYVVRARAALDAVILARLGRAAKMRAALQQIADWTPVTCEMTLAHEMGDIASTALTDLGRSALADEGREA